MSKALAFISTPLAFQDFHGKKQAQEDEAGEIKHVAQIDDSREKIVRMVENRKVFQEITQAALDIASGRADHPKQEQYPEGDDGRYDLILREGGSKQPKGEKSRCGEDITQVIGQKGPQVRVAQDQDEGQINEGGDQGHQEKRANPQ